MKRLKSVGVSWPKIANLTEHKELYTLLKLPGIKIRVFISYASADTNLHGSCYFYKINEIWWHTISVKTAIMQGLRP